MSHLVLTTGHHRCHPQHHPEVDLSMDEWLSVLKLSSKWHFNDLRDKAITKLTALPMTPIQRVLLAREYAVPSWLIEGYVKILAGMGPSLEYPLFISQEDAYDLGWDVALELSNIALRRFHGALKGKTPVRADIRRSARLARDLEEVAGAARRYRSRNDQANREGEEIDIDEELGGHWDKLELDETPLVDAEQQPPIIKDGKGKSSSRLTTKEIMGH
jgi:hypothetical protein